VVGWNSRGVGTTTIIIIIIIIDKKVWGMVACEKKKVLIIIINSRKEKFVVYPRPASDSPSHWRPFCEISKTLACVF